MSLQLPCNGPRNATIGRPTAQVARPAHARCWHQSSSVQRSGNLICRVTELPSPTSLQALEGDEWVPHDEVIRMLASHMSLECDFNPEDVWPSLKRTSANSQSRSQPTATSTPPAVQPPATAISTAPEQVTQVQLQQQQHQCIEELDRLEQLIAKLQATPSLQDKVAVLTGCERVAAFLANSRHAAVVQGLRSMPIEQQYVLLCLPAMGQDHVLHMPEKGQHSLGHSLRHALDTLSASLLRVEQFYDSIGGVLGYQCRSLGLIVEGSAEMRQARKARQALATDNSQSGSAEVEGSDVHVSYHVPRALDLAGEGGREVGSRTAAAGLMALPQMAEIYPVGGAGDRLGLKCEVTGECLPAAMLPYCGRTMMEGLIRDLQAREYLYYKLTGKQVTTPVAIMSSEAKGNHQRMTKLMESLNWFGRGRNAFRIFKQPLVPVISVSDGRWLLSGAMQPMAKPGGHGAIWKLMWDEGVFSWLATLNRSAALVRQISNPMAGMDTTLLALTGCGASRQHSAFGFMSCDRTIGASEGCNVLQERRVRKGNEWQYEYGYTNIEYTEFERLGISDQPVDGTSRRSVFPANTNVLYVGLAEAKKVVQDAIRSSSSEQLMPGLIFNTKKQVAYTDPLTGQQAQLHAGRMECTMQNIADYMTNKLPSSLSPSEAADRELSTFLVYNMRRKVTSSAKKKRDPSSTRISQTPDGSFYDLQRNAWHLLQQCAVKQAPELGSVEQYLRDGPGFVFLFNPALGPLWDVISQKLVGGSLQHGSEMVLEVAEARIRDVHVEGSLLVYADNIVGHMEPMPSTNATAQASSTQTAPGTPAAQPLSQSSDTAEQRLSYSSSCGRVHMSNVHIHNAGIDWAAPGNVYWQHKVARREAVRVLLRGQSEFEAHNVALVGDHTFEVPDGCRMVVSQDAQGSLQVDTYPLMWGMPTWQWAYTILESGQIQLQFVSAASATSPAITTTTIPGIPTKANGVVLPSLVHKPASLAPTAATPHSAHANGFTPSSSRNGVDGNAQPVHTNPRRSPTAGRAAAKTPGPIRTPGHASPVISVPPPSTWGMLQQLNAIEADVDFNI